MASGAFRGFGGAGGPGGPGGSTGVRHQRPASATRARGGGAGGAGGFGDLFGGLFNRGAGGGGTRPPRSRRGADVETEVRISFDDAVTGVTVPLGITERTTCPTCHGVGAKPGTAPRDCPVCNGTGLTTRNQGSFAFSEPCTNCHGTGSVIDDPCPTCHGERTVVHNRRLTTRIPAGSRGRSADQAGRQGRTRNRRRPGRRSVCGGACLGSRAVPAVSGDNLTLTVPVTFPELALGTTLTVPTLTRVGVSLRVPAGTTNGRKFRVKGAGVHRKETTGDLIVTVEVSVPQRLSSDAKTALEAFAGRSPTVIRASRSPAPCGRGRAPRARHERPGRRLARAPG